MTSSTSTSSSSSSSMEFRDITFAHPKRKIRGTFVIENLHNTSSSATLPAMHFNYVAKNQATSMEIKGAEVQHAEWLQSWDSYTLKLTTNRATVRFNGFKDESYKHFQQLFKNIGDIELPRTYLATKGSNVGEFRINEHALSFIIDDKLSFEVPLSSVEQTVVQGKNELGFEFKQDDTLLNIGEQLYEMRVWCPDVPLENDDDTAMNGDTNDADLTPALRFQKELLSKEDMAENQVKPIASFDVMLAVPRGRYTIEIYDKHIKLHNKTFNYKIAFEKGVKKPTTGITKMLLFNNESNNQHLFILGLNPPIRQGRTSYPYLVCQFPSHDDVEIDLNLSKQEIDAINSPSRNLLKATMIGATWDVISRVFNAITGIAVNIPKGFKARHGGAAIRCSLKAQDGYLFVMDHSFFFVKKPPTYIKNSAIQSVDFDRVSSSSAASKTFDMRFLVNEAGKPVEYLFTSINRDEFETLKDWMQSKNIPYTVTQADSGVNITSGGYDDEMGGDAGYRAMLEDAAADAEGDSDEDDSDFASSSDEGSGDESSEASSEEDAGMVEEVEEDESGNVKVRDRSSRKKTKGKGATGSKKGVISPFILFSNEYREKVRGDLQEKSDGKVSVTDISKELGARWKAMSDEERDAYKAQAEQERKRVSDETSGSHDGVSDGKKRKRSYPSAFQLFNKSYRTEHPEIASLPFGEQSTKISTEWGNMSEAEKQVYEEQRQRLIDESAENGDDRVSSGKSSKRSKHKKQHHRDESSSSDRENDEPIEVAAAPRFVPMK